VTKHFDELPVKASDRFNCVDRVATRIFDQMPPMSDDEADVFESAGFAPALRDASAMGRDAPTRIDNRDTPSVIVRTEKLLKSFLLALDDGELFPRASAAPSSNEMNATVYRAPDFAKSPDISFHAANRRAQLPSGIEILQGKPAGPVEESTLSSIRAMINEQQQEQAAVKLAEKREFNRRALPPLASQDFFDVPAFADEAEEPTLRSKCIAKLNRAFRGEYFLTFTLSGWSTLALMVFIDPGLSTALCFFSLFLLFVSYCLMSGKSA
jgi:hypothetical protein